MIQEVKKLWVKNWWFWVGVVLGALIITALVLAFPPTFYLPHKIPSLILPIEEKYDPIASLMPMGEKIEHPDGNGHPGIDFGFRSKGKIPYIAAMDGTISSIVVEDFKEKLSDMSPVTKRQANVIIKSGPYKVSYTEMDADTLEPAIKKGANIKQGDLIGYGNMMFDPKEKVYKEMIHWEFGSVSPVIDRFCPLDYFTAESKTRIEKIWAQTDWSDMKAQYPLICNGDYEGKYER